MDNLELLSDSELRTRLVQYGFPNLPITITTRKTLIKKLRLHMDNEKTKLRRETTNATRYSSGEESDNNDASKRRKNVRATVSNIPISSNPQPIGGQHYNSIGGGGTTTTAAASNNKYYNYSMPPPQSTSTISTLKNRKTIFPPTTSSISPIGGHSSSTTPYQRRFTTTTTPPSSSAQQLCTNETDEEFDIPSASSSPSASFNNYSSTLRSRYNNSSSLISGRNGISINNTSTPVDEQQSSSICDFTKRLLRLRGETVEKPINKNHQQQNNRKSYPQPITQLSQSQFNHNNNNNFVFRAQTHQDDDKRHNVPVKVAFNNLLTKLDEGYGIKQTLVPYFLLTSLIIFLVMVAFFYLTISPDIISNLNRKDTTYTLCPVNQQQNHQDNCIAENKIDSALNLLKNLVHELEKRVIVFKCKDKNNLSYIMTSRDIINYLLIKNDHLTVTNILEDIRNCAYLINLNKQWQISNVDENGNEINLKTVRELIDTTQSNGFAILNPSLPFDCLIYNKLQSFFLVTGSIALILIVFFVVNTIIRVMRRSNEKRKEQVNQLVYDIINSAIEQVKKDNSLIVLNHLRDQLISPKDRKSMEKHWMEAIKFLENNESRLQFEIVNINGEDYKAIKWIDTIRSKLSLPPQSMLPMSGIGSGTSAGGTSSSSSNSSSGSCGGGNSKKWQSPAFDNTNKIDNPPTPCLKIRQMFDKFETNDMKLKQIIQDAILEKVGNDCKIYDVQLDTNTCCVYVRCATKKDAGIVHDEINGWWFDKRLVSIKFVHLERYLNRFPKSLSGPMCLKPSNTKKLSLSQCDTSKSEHENDYDDDDDESVGRRDDDDEYDVGINNGFGK